MKRLLLRMGLSAAFMMLLLPVPAFSRPEADISAPQLVWKEIQPGLEWTAAYLPLQVNIGQDTGSGIIVVRIDPSRCEFTLHMASEDPPSRSLGAWASRHALAAGINAGMYLPDKLTSTGYMRGPNHTNHARMGEKLGAFFVAAPKADVPEAIRKKLPQADIIERGDPQWRERLEQYSLVVQNYRLIDHQGRILWPEDGAAHSIAAIGRDTAGRILFLLCEVPMTPAGFAATLQGLPLSLDSVMYVEGGVQAGVFVQDGPDTMTWMGRFNILNTRGDPHIPLPNVIGVRARQEK